MRQFSTRTLTVWSLLALSSLGLSCTPDKPPRTRDDIFQARQRVDTLFLTEDGQRVVAPGNSDRAVVVEKGGDKLAWPAWQCDNPNCPGRGSDGTLHVFPWPDPFKYVKPDGTIAVRQPVSAEDERKMMDFSEQKCPKCLTIRGLDKETPEQRQQYKDWCRPHVLPEAVAQLESLDKELEERIKRNEQLPSGR